MKSYHWAVKSVLLVVGQSKAKDGQVLIYHRLRISGHFQLFTSVTCILANKLQLLCETPSRKYYRSSKHFCFPVCFQDSNFSTETIPTCILQAQSWSTGKASSPLLTTSSSSSSCLMAAVTAHLTACIDLFHSCMAQFHLLTPMALLFPNFLLYPTLQLLKEILMGVVD